MKRIALALMFAGLICMFGCDEGATDSVEPVATTALNADKSVPLNPALLETLDYELATGTIYPGAAGWLVKTMDTWPGDCIFTIGVPSGAIQNQTEPVEYSMRIPTYLSYKRCIKRGIDLPLIIRLEPSNITFTQPISVMATYMPWEPVDADLFDFFFESIDPDDPNGGLVDAFMDKTLVRLIFSLPHFSDWQVSAEEED